MVNIRKILRESRKPTIVIQSPQGLLTKMQRDKSRFFKTNSWRGDEV